MNKLAIFAAFLACCTTELQGGPDWTDVVFPGPQTAVKIFNHQRPPRPVAGPSYTPPTPTFDWGATPNTGQVPTRNPGMVAPNQNFGGNNGSSTIQNFNQQRQPTLYPVYPQSPKSKTNKGNKGKKRNQGMLPPPPLVNVPTLER